MRTLGTVSLAAVLLAATAGTGFAAIGSDEAREANARNAAGATTQTAPGANQPGRTGQANPSVSGQAPGAGNSVGPGAGGDTANTPLGYAKGAGESSKVGKER